MTRPIRIYQPGLIYHVLNRGSNRGVVFVEHDDYRHYLDILLHYKEKFGFKLFSFCLMTNHVHLLLQVSETASISRIMQAITIAHTRHHHHKYQTSGHLWQGRFKSPLVSDDEYLLAAMRYMEQNPLRAKMGKHLKDYPWSSFTLNTQLKTDKLVDRDQNPVYLGLGNTPEERISIYKRFALAPLEDDKLQEIRRSLVGQMHYMSEKFHQQIADKLTRKRSRGRPRKERIELIHN